MSRDEVMQGDGATLRQRLAAILHFTGLHEQYPVDLKDQCVLAPSKQPKLPLLSLAPLLVVWLGLLWLGLPLTGLYPRSWEL